jgi:hypothetical protein
MSSNYAPVARDRPNVTQRVPRYGSDRSACSTGRAGILTLHPRCWFAARPVGAACIEARHFDGLLAQCIGDGTLVVAALTQDHRNGMAQAIQCEPGVDASLGFQLEPDLAPRRAEAAYGPRLALELAQSVMASCFGAFLRIARSGAGAGQ